MSGHQKNPKNVGVLGFDDSEFVERFSQIMGLDYKQILEKKF